MGRHGRPSLGDGGQFGGDAAGPGRRPRAAVLLLSGLGWVAERNGT